jgi:hypothetical protein
MIGDEMPRPGTGTFHLMFFCSLHSVGGLAFVAHPVPEGPRQDGQPGVVWVCLSLADDRSTWGRAVRMPERRRGAKHEKWAAFMRTR